MTAHKLWGSILQHRTTCYMLCPSIDVELLDYKFEYRVQSTRLRQLEHSWPRRGSINVAEDRALPDERHEIEA